MPTIVTALYDSKTTVTNAVDDLVSTGIPRERIAIAPDHLRVSVTLSHSGEPEVEEILNRHGPTEIHTRDQD